MKILFLNPPFKMVTEENGTSNYSPYGDRVVPYSLLTGAAYFKMNGLQVSFFDAGLYRSPEQATDDILKTGHPDIVITTLNCLVIPQTADMLQTLKKKYHFSSIIWCSEPFIDEIVDNVDAGDFFIFNEWIPTGYELCVALLAAGDLHAVKGFYFRNRQSVVFTGDRPHVPFRELPPPALEMAETRKYNHQQTMLSEGCGYNCLFCHFGNRVKEGWSAKSVDQCIDELRRFRTYGKKFIRIIDNELTARKDFVIELLQRIIDERLDIVWEVNVRVNHIDETTVSLMSRAGCIQAGFGVESGVQSILDANNKQISLEQITNTANLFKKYHILTRAYFLVGLRGDTEQTIRETFSFLKHEVNPDSAGMGIVVPYPATEYHRYLNDAGLLKKISVKQVCWIYKNVYGMSQIDDLWTEKPQWRFENFNFDEILRIYNEMKAEVDRYNELQKIKTLLFHGQKYFSFIIGQIVSNPQGIIRRIRNLNG